DANPAMLADSQFRITPGLAGPGTVSLESANYPGHYLRHKNYECWVESDDGSSLFAQDASFHRRAGLADAAGESFESVNFPGRHLRRQSGLAFLHEVSTAQERSEATFLLE
ncbi:MAG TPA: AbfB domain-containing protein, partial [Glycomyces sp.]|nr:AbfB domain-containing protein [Glycomyces sp.]